MVLFIPLLLFLTTLSCFPPIDVPPPQEWPFQEKGIKIMYKADDKLNLYADKPHTLIMCLYQLTDPNAFNNLRKDEDGLVQLLACNRFDKSVASNKKLFVYPGDDDSVILDRGENVRYIGVVAGYYNLWTEHVSHMFMIPVRVIAKGYILKKRVSEPDKMSIQLYLGPQEIQEIGE